MEKDRPVACEELMLYLDSTLYSKVQPGARRNYTVNSLTEA